MGHGTGRQAVIAIHGEFLGENVSLRAVRLLIVPGLALEKSVQVFPAAVEAVEQMLALQLLNNTVIAHSTTVRVVSNFSRRGRAFTGASRAAAKASYCLALKRNSRRSASVSAAASRLLSRTKALTLLSSTSAARLSRDFARGV